MCLVRWARFEEKNTVISTGGDFLRWQTVNVNVNNDENNSDVSAAGKDILSSHGEVHGQNWDLFRKQRLADREVEQQH